MLICNSCCSDVNPIKHFQNVKVNAQNIHLIMISESVSQNIIDYFDGEGTPVFIKNTNTLFNEIGYNYKTYKDYLNNGIYLTTALKCVKKEYVVSAQTIEACSFILEKEIEPFINAKVILLMGDFAIKAINYICQDLRVCRDLIMVCAREIFYPGGGELITGKVPCDRKSAL